MQVSSNPSDLSEHFEIVVDQDADPVDWDDVLVDFLLAVVRTEADQRRDEENGEQVLPNDGVVIE